MNIPLLILIALFIVALHVILILVVVHIIKMLINWALPPYRKRGN